MKSFDFYLSKKDEFVPENYISLTDLLLNPDYALPGYSKEEWVIGYKALDSMRRKTFTQAKNIMNNLNLKSFSYFWNGNIDAINEKGMNEFYKLSSFRDLCSCMIAFEEKIVSQQNKRNNRFISFGISKTNYNKYYNNLKEAIEKGAIPKKIRLADSHKRRSSDFGFNPRVTVSFSGENSSIDNKIVIDKIDLYRNFEEWCKLKGKTKKQGIYEAIQCLLKQNPVTQKEEKDIVSVKNPFSSLELGISEKKEGTSHTAIEIDSDVYEKSKGIIRRFNSDTDNISKKKLTFSTYVSQAVAAYNARVPLRYSDPIAYKEYLEIKEAEKYNQSIQKKGGKE